MSAPKEGIPFSTTRRYDTGVGTIGIQRRYHPGYITAEPYSRRDGFNIVWSSDLGPLDALRNADVLLDGLTASGFIRGTSGKVRRTTATNVIEAVIADPDNVRIFSAGSEEIGLYWHSPRNRVPEYEGSHGEMGLLVERPNRPVIQSIIAATAIEAVQIDLQDALDEFSEVIPGLRQA